MAKQALQLDYPAAGEDGYAGFISSPSSQFNDWADRVPDILHMWTTPTYESWFDHGGTHEDLDAIHYLTTFVNRAYTPATNVRGSLLADSFLGVYYWDESVLDEPKRLSHSPRWLENLTRTPEVREPSEEESSHIQALMRLHGKILVVMHVLVIHTDLQTGLDIGLFGLLGDAPIQIIDIAEEHKIEKFYALAEACEHGSPISVPQNFKRTNYRAGKQKLRDLIVRSYGTEDLVEKMQPAIMFRLCTKMCNHVAR